MALITLVGSMGTSHIPEINIKEIIERIKNEVEKTGKLPHKEIDQTLIPVRSQAIPEETREFRWPLDNFLWRYGRKYSRIINGIPLLRDIAKKQYYRLASTQRRQSSGGILERSSELDLDFLGTNWYYHDFLEQTKREGLKGRVKLFILRYFGFFAWWQGHLNRAIYQQMIKQKESIEERNTMIEDQLNQKIDRISKDLMDREKYYDQKLSSIKTDLNRTIEIIKQKFNHVFYSYEKDHSLDTMFVSFAERFRGTREEIKERLKVYLPYMQQIGAGRKDTPILDLGCGRGEWLELCQQNQLSAKGVDMNQAMIRQCLELGLDVLEGDILAVLETQGPNSLGAITGFHIIEHLSYEQIISLFDEAFRVLKTGGIVIFETPNPENLLVGSCDFYSDPTHQTLLVPEVIKFIAEQRGFIKTEILRLHKRKESTFTGDEFLDEIIYRFNKEQDYALIGYKP